MRENFLRPRRDGNNLFSFLESGGYIRLRPEGRISSKDLYAIYRMWCDENNLSPLRARSFSDAVIAAAEKYGLAHTNNIANAAGRQVWGFLGVEAVANSSGYGPTFLRTPIPVPWDPSPPGQDAGAVGNSAE